MRYDQMMERARFEKSRWIFWHPDAFQPGAFDRDCAGGYYNTAIEYAWRMWQEALRPSSCDAGDSIQHTMETTCPKCHAPYAKHTGDEVTTVCPSPVSLKDATTKGA